MLENLRNENCSTVFVTILFNMEVLSLTGCCWAQMLKIRQCNLPYLHNKVLSETVLLTFSWNYWMYEISCTVMLTLNPFYVYQINFDRFPHNH